MINKFPIVSSYFNLNISWECKPKGWLHIFITIQALNFLSLIYMISQDIMQEFIYAYIRIYAKKAGLLNIITQLLILDVFCQTTFWKRNSWWMDIFVKVQIPKRAFYLRILLTNIFYELKFSSLKTFEFKFKCDVYYV